MTCIAAVVFGGAVHMMGDSAGVAGWDLSLRKDNKVFRVGEVVMGFTSSFRMGQLLQYNLSVPKHHPDVDLFTYMVTEFIPAVRNCLKSGGYARIDNNEERGGCFLVGIEGRLFQIESDFQVGESHYAFDAVRVSDLLCMTDLVHAVPKGSMNDHLERNPGRTADGRGAS
ncbi:hypothetical protein KSAC_08700 [Komagataeibacter saccharivorans]|uniref:hypothetical protein n=1 Tax=Komagataeibacter saccharivorans TaxID=265959 RepID=UPI0010C48FA2|nr:hypothetical protein [Komagataeibacter saccharivorans]QBL93111.1 hypothetical protein KSAC_08700 [Komagataeibacter saccharivorans]